MGCDGVNGLDGQDGSGGEPGTMGCNGLDGATGLDGADGADSFTSFDLFILEGCLAVPAAEGAAKVRVIPNCDPSNGIIDVIVPYPSDLKESPAGYPVRYYPVRNGQYKLFDLPCPPKKKT